VNGTPANTDELLNRLLRHDSAAWDELISGYSGFLLAITRRTFAAYGVKATSQDHEDAVADVWKNLLENDRRVVRQCLERGNFPQTLQVLARNRSIDVMRKRQATNVPLHEGHGMIDPGEPAVLQAFPPEAVKQAVASLPPREKTLVNLFFLQGKKYREIAALTGIPQNSIGPTLARAIARLRKMLDDE